MDQVYQPAGWRSKADLQPRQASAKARSRPCSQGLSSAPRLTTCGGTSPRASVRQERNAASPLPRKHSSVQQSACGVTITLSSRRIGFSFGVGSCSKTSRCFHKEFGSCGLGERTPRRPRGGARRGAGGGDRRARGGEEGGGRAAGGGGAGEDAVPPVQRPEAGHLGVAARGLDLALAAPAPGRPEAGEGGVQRRLDLVLQV